MYRTGEGAILLAKKFIEKNNIEDEDVKQNIYIKSLESRNVKSVQQLNKKFVQILTDSMNREDIYVAVDTSTASPFNVFGSIENDILHDQLEFVMSTITEKERTILRLRYLNKMSLAEVGEILNLSRSKVCSIEIKAIHKLRNPLCLKLLGDFLTEPPICPMPKIIIEMLNTTKD